MSCTKWKRGLESMIQALFLSGRVTESPANISPAENKKPSVQNGTEGSYCCGSQKLTAEVVEQNVL